MSSVLQRIEAHGKTGLLVVKQGVNWVEFYLRDGRLMCIGPVRTNSTLGDRLLQDGVISPQALQETLRIIGEPQPGETRMALTLMDLGLVGHEALRSWATQKAVEVLQILLTWSYGEVHFEEGAVPPPDRLLVAISLSSLLSTVSVVVPPSPQTYNEMSVNKVQEQPQAQPVTATSNVSTAATLMDASQFLDDMPFNTSSDMPFDAAPAASSSPLAEALLPNFASPAIGGPSPSPSPLAQPVPVAVPMAPIYVDTSFMRPDMVLMPADLSAFREQNPAVQLTPDQWRLLTRVDGRTSLQAACQELGMAPTMVCQIAGELLAQGLILVAPPEQMSGDEVLVAPGSYATPGWNNGYVTPGYAAAAVAPWSAPFPTPDVMPQFSSASPFEAQSQWGNGGNGAIFIPGQGWIATPQPMQPLQPNGAVGTYGGSYARVAGDRY
ncbi:MAG: DUF4388 domain-containing protein [Chloroflexi bacterium]|nr:DUF4388 domain-containing protein [Chloroflexota bacterium]